jgi:branched-chain amino acid transport system ATP-binding protein
MLEVRDLNSFYGNAQILRGISLDVKEGSVVALLGRNGMGKTTLIRSIMGLTPPRIASGQVLYRGQDLVGRAPHEIARLGIALVPQGRRLFASLTVREHLTMSGKRGGRWPLDRIYALFPRLLERNEHRGNQLSGGERQMLAVARALSLDPDFLLMDEPSEGLSPVAVQQLEDAMIELKEAKLSILLVEQNLYSALTVADEVYIVQTGSVVFHGTARALEQDDAAKKQFLGVG